MHNFNYIIRSDGRQTTSLRQVEYVKNSGINIVTLVRQNTFTLFGLWDVIFSFGSANRREIGKMRLTFYVIILGLFSERHAPVNPKPIIDSSA